MDFGLRILYGSVFRFSQISWKRNDFMQRFSKFWLLKFILNVYRDSSLPCHSHFSSELHPLPLTQIFCPWSCRQSTTADGLETGLSICCLSWIPQVVHSKWKECFIQQIYVRCCTGKIPYIFMVLNRGGYKSAKALSRSSHFSVAL